jgi:hypothetical protein
MLTNESFFPGHRRAVCAVAELVENLCDRFVAIARLALLNEPGVLDGSSGIENDLDAHLARVRPNGAQVGKADGLTARQIHRRGDAHVRDVFDTHRLDESIEARNVDVAFERVLGLGIMRRVDDDVLKRRAGELLVQTRGGEIHVARHAIARLDEQFRKDVLSAATLMRRDDVLEAVMRSHRFLEAVEVSRTGICLVAEHHPRPLAIGHGVGAGVGQEVDVDVFRLQQEGVEAGVGECAFAIASREHVDRLDNLDLPGFSPAARTCHGSDGFEVPANLRTLGATICRAASAGL